MAHMVLDGLSIVHLVLEEPHSSEEPGLAVPSLVSYMCSGIVPYSSQLPYRTLRNIPDQTKETRLGDF